MPPSKSLLRTMSPKRSRMLTPEDEDGSSLERKSSLRVRSNSLRGGLRLKHKTHGAPVSEDDESFKREWGMSREAEVCTHVHLLGWGFHQLVMQASTMTITRPLAAGRAHQAVPRAA